MTPSPQQALERAVRMGDAPALRTALAAGADPNRPNDQGVPPLGQVFLSPWQKKTIQRFRTLRQTDPDLGEPGYWAAQERRGRVLGQVIVHMHRQIAKLAHLLIGAGADPDVTWQRPHPSPGQPPVTISAAVLALTLEVEAYQHRPVPRIEESLGRLQPWLERVTQWPPFNPIEDRPEPHSVLDDLELMLYVNANDADTTPYDDTIHSFIGGFIRTVAEHNTAQADRWLAQAAASDVALYPNALAGVGEEVHAWVAQGHHCRQSRARAAELAERPPAPAPSPRRRRS